MYALLTCSLLSDAMSAKSERKVVTKDPICQVLHEQICMLQWGTNYHVLVISAGDLSLEQTDSLSIGNKKSD